jgi:phosphohistidine swiveling domain-containing protein
MIPTMVKSFHEMTPDMQALAGGKGGMLAKMLQRGYPVPNGFVIFPSAFQGEKLEPSAWQKVLAHLNDLRKSQDGARFAVRSSALSEDSAQASFAGEFETILNVKTDEEVLEAIYTVNGSKYSERVEVYSAVKGMENAHLIAVVVQLMIPSEISGVLFTADPITGSHTHMIGNFVFGLGEQLVSGEANAYSFTMKRPKGKYEGSHVLQKYAVKLYKFAVKLEKEFNQPQDIEWAIANGKLYLLQARPITTLQPGSLDTYEWNDALSGDDLWVNTNIGEAIPDVMTPLTWSVLRFFDNEMQTVPGYYLWSGNICGRAYTNINVRLSVLTAFGINIDRGVSLISDVLGQMPKAMPFPIYPFSRLDLLKEMFPKVIKYVKKLLLAYKGMPSYLKSTPDWCTNISAQIAGVKTTAELKALWERELKPKNTQAWFSLLAGGGKSVLAIRVKKELAKLVGTEEANALLSNLRGNAGLESLGPVVGISKIINGEWSRQDYLNNYGHRGPHEFELSIPHPTEDPGWLDQQIAEFQSSQTNVAVLLDKQEAQFAKAWKRVAERYPTKAKRIRKKITKVGKAARLREAARSEFVRVFRLNRAFVRRAGELAGIGEEVFFLYLDEVLELLLGDRSALTHLPARKETYNKYKTLPPFPSVIRGRFDPFKWAEDPQRRVDYYDPTMPINIDADDAKTLKGFAGAAGRIEGTVRILTRPEEGEDLGAGEILVASTTNVGWTPLFPRAAAIITDIGAPLSHAAIVTRELGIPAVVGCGNATTRLKTGDRVMVDGGQGIVQIIE